MGWLSVSIIVCVATFVGVLIGWASSGWINRVLDEPYEPEQPVRDQNKWGK